MTKLIVILNERSFRYNWDVVWFNDFINELYDQFDLLYIEPEKYNDENFILEYGKIPDFILGYEIFQYPSNNSKKILITEDLHHRGLEVYDKLFEQVDIILPRFNIINNLFNDKFKNKIIEFPLYCSHSFLTININFNSINRVVSYGNIDHPQYHLRAKWINYMSINHANKFNFLKMNSEDTSNEIKKYSFGLVCGYEPIPFKNINQDKNSYIVGKFFEIMGGGLLLLADTSGLKEELTDYGFINMENFIEISFNNIDIIIDFIFNPKNKNKINEIRENGYNHIKKNHLLKNRIQTIKDIFDK